MRFWETPGLLEVVEGLLIKDPKRRLGCGQDGVRSIQRMPFFKSIDWAALDAKRVPTALRRGGSCASPTSRCRASSTEDINKVVEKLQHISLDGTIPDTSDDEMAPASSPAGTSSTARRLRRVRHEPVPQPQESAVTCRAQPSRGWGWGGGGRWGVAVSLGDRGPPSINYDHARPAGQAYTHTRHTIVHFFTSSVPSLANRRCASFSRGSTAPTGRTPS